MKTQGHRMKRHPLASRIRQSRLQLCTTSHMKPLTSSNKVFGKCLESWHGRLKGRMCLHKCGSKTRFSNESESPFLLGERESRKRAPSKPPNRVFDNPGCRILEREFQTGSIFSIVNSLPVCLFFWSNSQIISMGILNWGYVELHLPIPTSTFSMYTHLPFAILPP